MYLLMGEAVAAVSRVAVFRVRIACLHQRGIKITVGRNRKARLGFPWRAFS
jgi:hypothetical protein